MPEEFENRCEVTTPRMNCGCCDDIQLECNLSANHDVLHIEYRYEYDSALFINPKERDHYFRVTWEEITKEEYDKHA